MLTMSRDEAYAAVIHQAVHDAVHTQLAAPPDSVAGSLGLRKVTDWLAAEHGEGAVRDLAEELAVDLAEAFAALAAAEGNPALTVLDSWFHDVPEPSFAAAAAPHGPEGHHDAAHDPEPPGRRRDGAP